MNILKDSVFSFSNSGLWGKKKIEEKFSISTNYIIIVKAAKFLQWPDVFLELQFPGFCFI